MTAPMAEPPPDPMAALKRARRRLAILIVTGVGLMFVAFASAIVLLSSLIWTRDLDHNSDGDAVLKHLRRVRSQRAASPGPPTAPESASPEFIPAPDEAPHEAPEIFNQETPQ